MVKRAVHVLQMSVIFEVTWKIGFFQKNEFYILNIFSRSNVYLLLHVYKNFWRRIGTYLLYPKSILIVLESISIVRISSIFL